MVAPAGHEIYPMRGNLPRRSGFLIWGKSIVAQEGKRAVRRDDTGPACAGDVAAVRHFEVE